MAIPDHVKTNCTVKTTNCACFEKLTDDQKKLIEENQVTVEYQKGEIIAKQGAFATHIIMICEGLAKVFYERNDKKLILRIGGPGHLIGLTSLPENFTTFQYSASAYVTTIVRLIDIHIFRKLIRENSYFAAEIISILSETAIQKNQRFLGLSNNQAYGKLADLLLCLAGNIFKTTKFELLLSRKELAELAGMSTESVIRSLKVFEKDGWIRTKGKVIEILDSENLYKICQVG